MTKIISKFDFLPSGKQNIWLDNRLLQVNIEQKDLESRIETYEKQEIPKLSAKIASLEQQGKNKTDIEAELQKEKQRIYQEAVTLYLQEKKIGKTYEQALADPSSKAVIEAAQKNLDLRMSAHIKGFVDNYYHQKTAASSSAAESLRAVPAAFTKPDLSSPNPETRRLQELLAKQEKIKDSSKEKQAALKTEVSDIGGATTLVEEYTSPDSKYDHGIKDYDDDNMPWGKETDYNNPIREHLNGLLLANYVFFGGQAAGRAAVESTVEEAYKHYHSTFGDSRFDMADFNEKMRMKGYLDQVKQYAKDPRVLGMMAGFKKLLAENGPNKAAQDAYSKYLDEQFAEIGKIADEKQQMQSLFKIKPINEFIDIDKGAKNELSRIRDLTKGIPDYEGTDDENNKTQKQLNGYLYSFYLFGGKNSAMVDRKYAEAYKMYDDYKTNWADMGDRFDQAFLENKLVNEKADQPGFDLKPFLDKASGYTRFDEVKGAVAGLLQQTEALQGEKREHYLEYLSGPNGKLTELGQKESEQSQMLILSTIKSPEEFTAQIEVELRQSLLNSMIEATKQHNQFKFASPQLENFLKDPDKVPAKDYPALGEKALNDIQSFIKNRTDRYINEKVDNKDNPNGLIYKFNQLRDKNSKLEKALYSNSDLDFLRKAIEDLNKKFDPARKVSKSAKLNEAVDGKYLQKLFENESTYFDLAAEFDEKIKSVEEVAKQPAAVPGPTPEPATVPGVIPTGAGAPTGPGASSAPVEGTPEANQDKFEKGWSTAKEVQPALKDYIGYLEIKGDSAETRNEDGYPFEKINKGTELFRTAEDTLYKGRLLDGKVYIRASIGEKKYWVPEIYLNTKDESSETPVLVRPDRPSAVGAAAPAVAPGTTENPVEKTPNPATGSEKPIDSFATLKNQVETQKYGATFDLEFNGKNLPCRLQKTPTGYLLNYRNNEVEGSIPFRTWEEIKPFIDQGRFYQYLNTQMLQDQRSWDRFRDSKWLDDADEIKRTGPNSVYVELDWKGRDVKCNFDVGPDGRINYRLLKDEIGPSGENIRVGSVSDFTQLVEALSHAKQWVENYGDYDNDQQKAFGEYRERLLASMMDPPNFDTFGTRIGAKYNFQNFYNQGYAYMDLNWDNQDDFYVRNQSKKNPRLEVKLNDDNTITYRLTNHDSANGTRVGCFGTVQSFDLMIAAVENARKNPQQNMITPLSSMPVLPQYVLNN